LIHVIVTASSIMNFTDYVLPGNHIFESQSVASFRNNYGCWIIVWEKLLLRVLAGMIIRAVKLLIIKQGVRHYSERYSKNSKVLSSRLSGLHLYHGVAGSIWNSVISLFLHPAPGPF